MTRTPERLRSLARSLNTPDIDSYIYTALLDAADEIEQQQAELEAARAVIEQVRVMPMFRLTGEGWNLLQLLESYDAAHTGQEQDPP